MSSEFPGRPWLLKGALVVFEADSVIPTNLIVFQYNPDSLSRSLQEQIDWERSSWEEQRMHVVQPTETFQLEIELDAADQLEGNNLLTRGVGLHPTLAALELLLYPPAESLLLAKAMTELGLRTIAAGSTPKVLLVWGAPRVVPVKVTSFSVTEEAFDQILNPIRAKVSLGLQTLSQREINGTAFETIKLINLGAKEVLSRLNLFNSAVEIRGMLPI